MEDILNRLGKLEAEVSDLKSNVSALLATVPYLATKADVIAARSAAAELIAKNAIQSGPLGSK